MKKAVALFSFLFLSLCVLPACQQGMPPKEQLIPPEGRYVVEILRDEWGVPHIFGKRDADTAYGLAWAHCEDDFSTIQEAMFLTRAKFAAIKGKEMAPFDYLVHLFRFRQMVEEHYESALAPQTRALCEAYADGYNHYAATHPDEVIPGILPLTGQDVVLGFVAKSPFFFGLDKEVKKLFSENPTIEVAQRQARVDRLNPYAKKLPVGSNTFAVAPSRTPDGKTHLNINSHQPWTGPVAWYEAHLVSEEGLDIVGGVFPGTPVILHGHNRHLGWAHTVNKPDLADIYVLEMNPDNDQQYRFDGEWRDLEITQVPITVKLWGALKWRVKQEAAFSVYGPVVRRPHGVYAIRYAGYGDIRQVEQWYRMGKARSFEEFEAAMRMQALPSFNVGYADKEGNIWYCYNAKFPKRAAGYDWQKYLPGNTSETLWTEYLPFESMPQVKNPASGFIQNCNSTPYRTTLGPDNPKPEDFPAACGIETDMTNRALRALELFGNDESITEEDFYTYKYDWCYSKDSEAAHLRQQILDETDPEGDPLIEEALALLASWDLKTNPENKAVAIAVLTMEPIVRAKMFGDEAPELIPFFKERVRLLKNTFGRIDVPWEKVNRLVQGETNLGLGGGPDTLNAVYGDWHETHLEGVAGDCYVLLAHWDKEGRVHSESIHQFGAATTRPDSPHYTDQARLFVERKMKPVWLEKAEILKHLEARYAPGQKRE